MHLEPVGRVDALVEAQRRDAEDFLQRCRLFGGGVVGKPAFKLPQDRVLGVPPYANDERDTELRLVGCR